MNLESSSITLGKSMNVDKQKTKTKKTFLVPEDKLDKYLTYEVEPLPQTLVERDPVEGARLEEIRQRLIVELDRMRREYQATGRITYELEVTDDEQDEEGNQMEVKNVEEMKEPDAAPPPVVRAPIISVGRSSRRRFRQGIVKRAGGGGYEKIV